MTTSGVSIFPAYCLVHQVRPADLALLIAAAFPDLADQEAAGVGPPPAQLPAWGWWEEGFSARLQEALTTLDCGPRGAAAVGQQISGVGNFDDVAHGEYSRISTFEN